ncbi:hypothetical protein RND71_034272 [Anisodus tanguticus]|uniref:Uncharacterized protein n=1 Tax=Anisodus tanguticus TaxID=243964 RepID=A0AAE1UWW4_9SOLA|nr:hypothetical protein RND71_034272 [Anisodus tanguticus]
MYDVVECGPRLHPVIKYQKASTYVLRRGDSFTVVKLCGNMSQRQQKGGEDGRLYSKSMSELASAKIIIDAGSLDNIASTKMVDQLGLLSLLSFLIVKRVASLLWASVPS